MEPDEATVEAAGLLSEALEYADRARGHLYTFHQLTYWAAFRALEADVREQLTGGRRHLQEARLKTERRTAGHPRHRPGPRLED